MTARMTDRQQAPGSDQSLGARDVISLGDFIRLVSLQQPSGTTDICLFCTQSGARKNHVEFNKNSNSRETISPDRRLNSVRASGVTTLRYKQPSKVLQLTTAKRRA
ncbi:uncharacterized [Tachysurus ichikawai]